MEDYSDINVLILDDEDAIRLSMSEFLRDSGFTVFEAENTEIALELLSKQAINVAIVDLNIPQIGGNNFIIEANKNSPELKYIIHTGSQEYRPPESFRQYGIEEDDIIFKPIFDLEIIINKIVNTQNRSSKN